MGRAEGVMQSSFAVVAHRAGRLIEVRARGMFTLYDAATLVRRVRTAHEEIGGEALLVGDLRRSRAVEDEIVPLVCGALKELGLPILRAGFLVDWPAGALPDACIPALASDPSARTFYETSDLLAFLGEWTTPEEQERLEGFIEEGHLPRSLRHALSERHELPETRSPTAGTRERDDQTERKH